MRELEIREYIKDEEIVKLIEENNILDPNTFLVLNGGTGLGKTKQTMINIKEALAQKLERQPRIIVVESRTNTVDQISNEYIKQIETIGGITVKQRIAFMNLIKNEKIEDYDWIIIDECHGLFSEASFAEDAEFIANWIKTTRKPQHHIIFITANDEYFDAIARRYFPEEYNFIYLFANKTKYYSPTYVKKIYTIITNLMKSRIMSLLSRFKGKKGIIFFPRASQVLEWYKILSSYGFNPGIIVSQGNQTTANLTTLQENYFKDFLIDKSNGEAGLTMADICEFLDIERQNRGLPQIRKSIIEECVIPSDIDMLITTDTLQEGVSILSQVDYIVIEGYTEVEVRQKLGRYRGDLDELYLLFNPSRVTREINENKAIFDLLFSLVEKNDQLQLAEFYGRQEAAKYVNKYVIKYEENGVFYYRINQAMYQNFLETSKKYEQLPSSQYIQNLLAPYVKNPSNDIIHLGVADFKLMDIKDKLFILAEKWTNIPLKGPAQDELIKDFQIYEITSANGKPPINLKGCLNLFSRVGIQVKTAQANKEDLEKYPKYLTKRREKFKYLVFDP